MKHCLLEKYKFNKRLANLENTICEAKQVGTLYHVCSLKEYLKYVLPNDQLSSSGRYYNYLYGGDNYVSFTRDKKFVLDTRDEDIILIQIVVDGDKLSEKYKIGPYNDFAFGGSKGAVKKKKDDFRKREMEECVKGPIKNLSKYVKEVRFDISAAENLTSERELELLRRKRKSLSHLVYNKFLRDRSANIGVNSGASLDETLQAIKAWQAQESVQEMLFSYDLSEIKDAIEIGADVNRKHDANGYPLAFYSDDGDAAPYIKLLLKAGADPNIKVNDGQPLISYTIECMYDDLTELYIKAGANVNASDSNGVTPLMEAAAADNADIVRAIIAAGADVNAKDKDGDTALAYASDEEIEDVLEKAGVNN